MNVLLYVSFNKMKKFIDSKNRYAIMRPNSKNRIVLIIVSLINSFVQCNIHNKIYLLNINLVINI